MNNINIFMNKANSITTTTKPHSRPHSIPNFTSSFHSMSPSTKDLTNPATPQAVIINYDTRPACGGLVLSRTLISSVLLVLTSAVSTGRISTGLGTTSTTPSWNQLMSEPWRSFLKERIQVNDSGDDDNGDNDDDNNINNNGSIKIINYLLIKTVRFNYYE